MSGLFQRIARRGAERPDDAGPTEAVDVTSADATDAGDAIAGDPPTDVPTQQFEALTPTPPAEQPATAQPAAIEAAIEAGAAAPTTAPAGPSPEPVAAPASAPDAPPPSARRPGFRERGRIRRRLRYLRKLRELQVRDLGGLVFDLRRFGRTRDDLLAEKIGQIRACDDELRSLEGAAGERRDVRDVREPGIGGTCPRCFALYGSTDRFCSTCGAALGGAVQGPAQVLQP